MPVRCHSTEALHPEWSTPPAMSLTGARSPLFPDGLRLPSPNGPYAILYLLDVNPWAPMSQCSGIRV